MKKTFTDILSILNKRERKHFWVSALLSFLLSVADILSLALLFYVVSLYTSSAINYKISLPLKSPFEKNGLLAAGLLLLVFAAKSWGSYRLYQFQYRLVSRVVSRISAARLKRHLYGSYNNHVTVDNAVLVRRILYQPIEFGSYLLSGFQQIIAECMLIVLVITALLLYDASLLLSVSFTLAPAIAVITFINRKKLQAIRANIKTVNEQTLQYLNEALSGFTDSNVYGKNEAFAGRYARLQGRLNRYIADIQVTQGLPSRFFELFSVFGLCVLIAYSLVLKENGQTAIITIGAFVAAAYKIIPGISRIINLKNMLRTYSYVLPDLTVEETPSPTPIPHYPHIHRIELSGIHLSYDNKQVLHGLTAVIETGKLTGVKGDSGKGKSSMLNMLLGFVEPEKGDILFNGTATTAEQRRQWQTQVAYVKQQAFVLHESIRDNIVLFEEDHDACRLACAVEKAGLHEFVNQFKEGPQHVISEDGKNISGGQKQRIAIARALYKNASVIILDEPFNELDEASETALLQYFKQLAAQGKMVILVTHNSNSLAGCDTLINLNEN
ncbi:ATP-binding cassette domain-containing protein [Foetidibacter luteolus]|uniref:ATP-binding cassette domain-containing protein n=1 Tax=Foetidibacter luteolus TaxID=2608880 RepID=UPI00129B9C07|nr:ABC transporter ATP-binding protein [Foetidibacter luteolus]